MVRLAARSRRRRWTGEIPTAHISDLPGDGRAVTDPGGETTVDVRRALAGLPAGKRDVLVLRYLDDCSEAQTAALLAISIGTVKSRASRGLENLRRAGLLAVEGDRHG